MVGCGVYVCRASYVFNLLCDFEHRLLGYVESIICVISNDIGACVANFDGLMVRDCVGVHACWWEISSLMAMSPTAYWRRSLIYSPLLQDPENCIRPY